MSITVRPVTPGDGVAWRRLYDGYATFYKREMTDAIAGSVWNWLHDPSHELDGLVAETENGELVGLAHYRRMPSPLRGGDVGFLDDLFVEPAQRGSGAAKALIDAVAEAARTRGWPVVRWITADDNYRARGLYDRLAVKTSWNLYELAP
ncbi:MAG: GNAT family N-acetyltransferase [Geminicoccaceae bacterium]